MKCYNIAYTSQWKEVDPTGMLSKYAQMVHGDDYNDYEKKDFRGFVERLQKLGVTVEGYSANNLEADVRYDGSKEDLTVLVSSLEEGVDRINVKSPEYAITFSYESGEMRRCNDKTYHKNEFRTLVDAIQKIGAKLNCDSDKIETYKDNPPICISVLYDTFNSEDLVELLKKTGYDVEKVTICRSRGLTLF